MNLIKTTKVFPILLALAMPTSFLIACSQSSSHTNDLHNTIEGDYVFLANNDLNHLTNDENQALNIFDQWALDKKISYAFRNINKSLISTLENEYKKGHKTFVTVSLVDKEITKSFFEKHDDATLICANNDFTTDSENHKVTNPGGNYGNMTSILFPQENLGYLSGLYSSFYLYNHQKDFQSVEVVNANGVKKRSFQIAALTSKPELESSYFLDAYISGLNAGSDSISRHQDQSESFSIDFLYQDASKQPSIHDYLNNYDQPDDISNLFTSYQSKGVDLLLYLGNDTIKDLDKLATTNHIKILSNNLEWSKNISKEIVAGISVKKYESDFLKVLNDYWDQDQVPVDTPEANAENIRKNKHKSFQNEYINKVHVGEVQIFDNQDVFYTLSSLKEWTNIFPSSYFSYPYPNSSEYIKNQKSFTYFTQDYLHKIEK